MTFERYCYNTLLDIVSGHNKKTNMSKSLQDQKCQRNTKHQNIPASS